MPEVPLPKYEPGPSSSSTLTPIRCCRVGTQSMEERIISTGSHGKTGMRPYFLYLAPLGPICFHFVWTRGLLEGGRSRLEVKIFSCSLENNYVSKYINSW